MELTDLDYFPSTGSEGAEYRINGTHYKFSTDTGEWISQEKATEPTKAVEPVKTAATK